MNTRLACVLFVTSLAACGSSDNNTKTPDAALGSAAQMITITGTAKANNGSSTTPLAGVAIGVFSNSDENTPIGTATSDTAGNWMVTVPTGGHALDGFIKATVSGYIDSYLYPPAPIAADFSGAAMNIVTMQTYGFVSTLCHGNQMDANGGIAVEVVDATAAPVAGATISSTPAASTYCYNSGGSPSLPSNTATATAADGLGYMFNVTGSAMVTANLSGKTFIAHTVNARAGALTTTQIMEQ